MKTKNYLKWLSLLPGIVWISYLPAQNGWEQMTDMPQATSWYGSCLDPAGEKAYIFGGGISPSGSLVLLDDTQIYDFETDTWSTGADMLQESSSLSAELVNGKMYIVGEYVNPHALTTVKEYDPVSDTWEEKGLSPEILFANGSCVFEGLIYLFGGRGVDPTPTNTVRSYNPETDTWTELEDMPYGRYKSTVCIFENEIYLFGGNPSLKYTPSSDSWTELNTGDCDIDGFATPIVYGDRILLFGGYKFEGSYPNPCNEIWAYYPAQDNMVKLDMEMPFDRFTMGHKYDHYVYLFGGHFSNTLGSVTDEVWRFDLNTVSIEENKYVSREDLILYPNHPNPFSGSTVIAYELLGSAFVSLEIFDVLGNQVAILRNDSQAAGRHEVTWNTEGFPEGIYFATLKTENGREVRKLVKF